jgi:hypothetical protein
MTGIVCYQVKVIADKNISYSLYLLAMFGKADIPTMNYYKTKTSEMALDSRYMLAASYLAVGDRKSYNELLPGSFTGEESSGVLEETFILTCVMKPFHSMHY